MNKKRMVGFDPTTKINDLRSGKPFMKSYPSQEELSALPIKKDIEKNGKNISKEEPDLTKLPKETVGNIILTCLATYDQGDKRDGFYCNAIANLIITTNPVDLKEKFKTFLIKVLEKSIIRKETSDDEKKTKINKGIYSYWVIAQVLSILGYEPEED